MIRQPHGILQNKTFGEGYSTTSSMGVVPLGPGEFHPVFHPTELWQLGKNFPQTWDTLWEFMIHIPSGNSTWLLNMAHS